MLTALSTRVQQSVTEDVQMNIYVEAMTCTNSIFQAKRNMVKQQNQQDKDKTPQIQRYIYNVIWMQTWKMTGGARN